MTAVVGQVWSWINPLNLYRPWAKKPPSQKIPRAEAQEKSSWRLGGVTSWVWAGWRNQKTPTEEFWEAQEDIVRPLEVEDLKAETSVTPPPPPRWWKQIISSPFNIWPLSSLSSSTKLGGLDRINQGSWDSDAKDDFSDYGTPPPSPDPLSKKSSAFGFFAQSWSGEILPEHYEICFNFIRHLFDLFVVGFLWTVSPPTKFVLDVLGVQGALKLWLHGMAMFLVSSVGMAGLLWLVQEYLAQFALVYGIIQAVVISVSVRQSVILGTEDEGEDAKEEEGSEEESEDALALTQSSCAANWSINAS
ncbi:uncharacterized protein C6orf47 homolog [Clarias gariepinus]|uniref:uncharacterized protein C6orf47 homolog n=1 Tax=Clarias gariepinus TaxID=13013 RepID=UPI00234C7216|nr:uncharacterized protein C6orf47 homolog [Clarias gariepinus]